MGLPEEEGNKMARWECLRKREKMERLRPP
jgi:hypothetical protein